MISEIEQLFGKFYGRQQALEHIYRYKNYPVMFYRSNLFTHARRVWQLAVHVSPYIKSEFDSFDMIKFQLLSYVHDDIEIIIGDVPLAKKVRLNTLEIKELERAEFLAVSSLAKKFPKMVGSYLYGDLLNEALVCKTIEAQFVKYIDKFEGLAEACHEIFAGNQDFAKNLLYEGKVMQTPFEIYLPYFKSFTSYYPQTKKVIDGAKSIFSPFPLFEFEEAVKVSKPHTKDSLLLSSGYFPYDKWKTIMSGLPEAEASNLYLQKEFHM